MFNSSNDCQDLRKDSTDRGPIFRIESEKKLMKNKYDMLNCINIIGNHKKNKINNNLNHEIQTVDFLLEINQGFISAGTNKEIILYSNNYNIKNILIVEYPINNILELVNKKFKNARIFICCKDDLKIVDLENTSKLDRSLQNKEIELSNITFLLKLKENDFIICYEKNAYSYLNLFGYIYNKKLINLKSIKGGIKLNNNFSAFKVIDFFYRENNGIYFYTSRFYKIIQKKVIGKNYAFIYTINGLTIIPREEIESENKILLCACKKYLKYQKNGILLINIKFLKDNYNDIDINSHFYETGNFEVYCFCQLLKIKKEKNISNEIIKEETPFFLIGGFDQNKKLGLIKLYEIIYDSKFFNNRIEYIQDIIIKKNDITEETKINDFKGFKKPISCIIQDKSNEEGNILISCWDGNVYVLKLNIEEFLDLKSKIIDNKSFI